MPKIRIRTRQDGPYVLEPEEGVEIEIVDVDRQPFPLPDRRPIALCRCGASASRPFCDGTHKHNGFTACDRAPRDEASGG